MVLQLATHMPLVKLVLAYFHGLHKKIISKSSNILYGKCFQDFVLVNNLIKLDLRQTVPGKLQNEGKGKTCFFH